MLKKFSASFIIIISLTVLTVCSTSEKDTLAKVENKVQKIFADEKPKSTEETKDYSYRLPFRVKEIENAENNIVLKKGNNTYLLFYDDGTHEGQGLFEEEKNKDRDPFYLKQIDKQTNSFVKIIKLPNDLYELTVGSGNVKITTTSTMDDLSDQAVLSAKLVHSFEFK